MQEEIGSDLTWSVAEDGTAGETRFSAGRGSVGTSLGLTPMKLVSG